MSKATLNQMTKAELIRIISDRNDETQAQRLRISVLEGELALRPRAIKVVAHTPWVRPPNMEAARQVAMASGQTTLVTTH